MGLGSTCAAAAECASYKYGYASSIVKSGQRSEKVRSCMNKPRLARKSSKESA